MAGRRSSPLRPDSARADAAARRLALIAADLGGVPRASGSGSLGSAESGEREGQTGSEPLVDTVDRAADRAVAASSAGAEPDTRATPDHAPGPWWDDHTRVVPAAAPMSVLTPTTSAADAATGAPPSGLPQQVEPPPLPTPGRHAARRPRRSALPAVVTTFRERVPGLGPGHVAVVALVVALGLAVTTWWVARDRAEPVAPVSARPATPLVAVGESSDGVANAPVAPAGSEGSVTVDVAGKVRRPGIVVLDHGARVIDALEAAGGARGGVDLTPINLARVLVDGEQIVVGAPAGAAASPPAAGTAGGSGPLVNLNTATQAELETLAGVGPVTAQAILAWRDQHGGFTSIDELLEVDGIGDKTLASLTPHVTV